MRNQALLLLLMTAAVSSSGLDEIYDVGGMYTYHYHDGRYADWGDFEMHGARIAIQEINESVILCGDRIRMTVHGSDPGVFVRSVAARGHLGGLSRTTARVIDVMDAAGKDVVIVETVGAGQSEVEIAGLADVNLVVSAPGLGDDVQAIKAGILEIADILVVNKADRPLAERTARQLERLAGPATVLRTVATSGAGIAELADAIAARWVDGAGGHRASPQRRARRLIVAAAADRVRTALEALDDKAIEALCDAVLDGSLDIDEAALRSLELIAEDRR